MDIPTPDYIQNRDDDKQSVDSAGVIEDIIRSELLAPGVSFPLRTNVAIYSNKDQTRHRALLIAASIARAALQSKGWEVTITEETSDFYSLHDCDLMHLVFDIRPGSGPDCDVSAKISVAKK